jgi:hypothetical protein
MESQVPADGKEIASRLGPVRSTVAGWRARPGLARLSSLAPKQPVRRDQRERPGELLHPDIDGRARQTWRHVADQPRPRWPKLGKLMDDSEDDVLAYMAFPSQPGPSCIPRTRCSD